MQNMMYIDIKYYAKYDTYTLYIDIEYISIDQDSKSIILNAFQSSGTTSFLLVSSFCALSLASDSALAGSPTGYHYPTNDDLTKSFIVNVINRYQD